MAPVALRVVDQYFGLDRAGAPPRPSYLMETPFGFGATDQTYVGRTFAALEAAAPAAPAAACGAGG